MICGTLIYSKESMQFACACKGLWFLFPREFILGLSLEIMALAPQFLRVSPQHNYIIICVPADAAAVRVRAHSEQLEWLQPALLRFIPPL